MKELIGRSYFIKSHWSLPFSFLSWSEKNKNNYIRILKKQLIGRLYFVKSH